MAVTMKDIADKLGISLGTVSRALNDKPDIDQDTKELILETAEELNYLPNFFAKSLRTKRTKTIGIIIPDIKDPVFAEILYGATQSARKHGYQMIESMLLERGLSVNEELKAIRTLISKRVDGLLLQPEHEDRRYFEALQDCPVPYVFINRYPKNFEGNYVSHNHEHGAYLAARHLLEKGHEEIVFIVRSPRTSTVMARINGCSKALREYQLPENALIISECGDTIKEAYQQTLKLLEKAKPPFAFFVWQDIMALGVLKAASDFGLNIPKQVAVVGYNDIEMAPYFFPPLTTVRQKISDIGVKAADLLINRLKGEAGEKDHILIQPELIVRNTT